MEAPFNKNQLADSHLKTKKVRVVQKQKKSGGANPGRVKEGEMKPSSASWEGTWGSEGKFGPENLLMPK